MISPEPVPPEVLFYESFLSEWESTHQIKSELMNQTDQEGE